MKGGSFVYKNGNSDEYLMTIFTTVRIDSFGPYKNSEKWVKWCWRAVRTRSQGLEPSGPGAKLGAPPSPGTAAPRFTPFPPAQLWGQGWDFRVWQIALSGQRLLKLSLNATAREKGEILGIHGFRGQSAPQGPSPSLAIGTARA